MKPSDNTNVRNEKIDPSKTVAYALLSLGAVSLIASIMYSSSILAFVGIGLPFWGALLLYIRPTKYTRTILFDSAILSLLRSINSIIADLDYNGKAIYLPRRYAEDLKSERVFVPSKDDLLVQKLEKLAKDKVLFENPKGICLFPPGLDLTNLYEKELGMSFSNTDINRIRKALPKLFMEDLEIAENLLIDVDGNTIEVKISGIVCKDLCREVQKLVHICGSVGCPICSSIAVTFCRATGKPIIIEKAELSEDGKVVESSFRALGEI